MHKFAITRWRKEWTKLLEEFDNIKTLDDAKRLSRRLAVWRAAAKGGHLSKRYQEDLGALWDRYAHLVRNRGFKIKVDQPTLNSNVVSGFFNPQKDTIFLEEKNPVSLMHEFFEGVSVQRLKSRWAQFPLRERLRTTWHMLSMRKVPLYRRIILAPLLTSPSMMKNVGFGGMYKEPFSHYRNTLQKERQFLKFMLLHPDPEIQKGVKTLLFYRNAPVNLKTISYIPSRNNSLPQSFTRKTLNSLFTSEWGLSKVVPRNALFVKFTKSEPIRFWQNPFNHRVGGLRHELSSIIKKLSVSSDIEPLFESALAFDYSPARGRSWQRAVMGTAAPGFKDVAQPPLKFPLSVWRRKQSPKFRWLQRQNSNT